MAQTNPTTPTKLSTREIAEKLGTTPRMLRRFLRSERKGVGTGSRYEFTTAQVASLKKQFAAWEQDRQPSREASQDTKRAK